MNRYAILGADGVAVNVVLAELGRQPPGSIDVSASGVSKGWRLHNGSWIAPATPLASQGAASISVDGFVRALPKAAARKLLDQGGDTIRARLIAARNLGIELDAEDVSAALDGLVAAGILTRAQANLLSL